MANIVFQFDIAQNIQKLTTLKVPDMMVHFSVQVPIDNPKMDAVTKQQLTDAGTEYLQKTRKEFTEAIIELDKKITAKVKAGSADAHKIEKEELATANTVAKQIAAATEAGCEAAVQKEWKAITDKYKELKTYRLKIAIKIVWTSIKIGVAIAQLSVSSGADISGWIGLASGVYKLGTIVYELAKDADAVKEEVGKAYDGVIKAVANARKKQGSAKDIIQIKDVDPAIKKVEDKLKVFGPKVTGVDSDSKKLSTSLEKLLDQAAKDSKSLKPNVLAKVKPLEAKIDGVIKKIISLQEAMKDMRKYQDAVEISLKAFAADFSKGAEITCKVREFLKTAKEICEEAKDAFDMVKDIVSMAA